MKMTKEQLEAAIEALPANKKKKLEGLVVTTENGNTFDANLEARQNMADAILASNFTGTTEAIWRLSDNSEIKVSVDELKEAHMLSLQAYAKAKSIGE